MIKINGDIGIDYTYANFVSELALEQDKKIIVQISSCGGYVDIGFMIYEELERLKSSGRIIETHAIGKCNSIAVLIFMSGSIRLTDCNLIIHNPMATVEGDADMLMNYAKEMNQIKKKIAEVYLKHVTMTEQQVFDLMDIQSIISPTEALNTKFATGLLKPTITNSFKSNDKAIAIINENQIRKMAKNEKSVSERFKNLCSDVMNLLKGIKNLVYVTKEELELIVSREEGLPEIGDVAEPDGVHGVTIVFEDGRTEEWIITVADGYITEIMKMNEPNVDEIVNKLKESIALNKELLADNQRLSANQVTPENASILNRVRAAGGINKLLSGVKNQSSYTAPTRTGSFKNEPSNNGIVDVEALKDKYKSRRK